MPSQTSVAPHDTVAAYVVLSTSLSRLCFVSHRHGGAACSRAWKTRTKDGAPLLFRARDEEAWPHLEDSTAIGFSLAPERAIGRPSSSPFVLQRAGSAGRLRGRTTLWVAVVKATGGPPGLRRDGTACTSRRWCSSSRGHHRLDHLAQPLACRILLPTRAAPTNGL